MFAVMGVASCGWLDGALWVARSVRVFHMGFGLIGSQRTADFDGSRCF